MGPFLGKMLRTVLLFFSLSSIRGGNSPMLASGISEDAWTCRKDYSRPCAEGWHQVNASRECVAPLSYRGPCPRFLQMENKTTKKRLLEGECRIFWPCLDQCERNYSLQCPEQWAPEDEKTCRPLAIYEGTCLPSHDFSNMTDAQKEIWSNKCETDWPCMVNHASLYSAWGMSLCGYPQFHSSNSFSLFPRRRARRIILEDGWTKESNTLRSSDGSCYAPVKYSGPCLSRMSLLNVDEDMKVALEKLCNVSFPCVETCDLDMNDPCPTGWFVKSDAFGNALACLPPDNYRGPCGEETKLIAIFVTSSRLPRTEGLTNLKSKKRMAYECAVKWPFANLINYEQFCPDGWTKSEQVYCVAPHNYVGPCAKKKLFATFERGMKKAYAEECDVEWPLLGKEAPVSYRRGSGKRSYTISLCNSQCVPLSSFSYDMASLHFNFCPLNDNAWTSAALRKRKYNIGPVEPFTGAIISGTVK
eukprot:XP_002260730.1 hypothetical protein, conserved in Plasmodium species [Plasmodium knowlesi strain H]